MQAVDETPRQAKWTRGVPRDTWERRSDTARAGDERNTERACRGSGHGNQCLNCSREARRIEVNGHQDLILNWIGREPRFQGFRMGGERCGRARREFKQELRSDASDPTRTTGVVAGDANYYRKLARGASHARIRKTPRASDGFAVGIITCGVSSTREIKGKTTRASTG